MLTQDQIQLLYKFCEKHYVNQYDLQTELVDHLANAIEEKMQQNSKLSFEQALHEVFKGFGIFGFAKVVAERAKALDTEYRKEYWQIFKAYFTIPKIALTFLIFSILSILSFFFYSPVLIMLYALGFSIFGGWTEFFLKKNYKKPVKSLLCYRHIEKFYSIVFAYWIPFVYFILFKKNMKVGMVNDKVEAVAFIAFFTLMIVCILADFEAYKKMYQAAKQKYPLAFQK